MHEMLSRLFGSNKTEWVWAREPIQALQNEVDDALDIIRASATGLTHYVKLVKELTNQIIDGRREINNDDVRIRQSLKNHDEPTAYFTATMQRREQNRLSWDEKNLAMCRVAFMSHLDQARKAYEFVRVARLDTETMGGELHLHRVDEAVKNLATQFMLEANGIDDLLTLLDRIAKQLNLLSQKPQIDVAAPPDTKEFIVQQDANRLDQAKDIISEYKVKMGISAQT